MLSYSEFLQELRTCPIEEFMDLTWEGFRNFLSKRKLAIWGASKGGRKVLKLLKELKIKPSYFIDSDLKKQGRDINGIKILSPTKLEKDTQILVLIGTCFKSEIIPFLEKRKIPYITDIKDVLEMLEIMNNELNRWTNKRFSVLNYHLRELYEVLNLLEDNESKDTFLSYLKYLKCFFLFPKKSCKVSPYPQYFHPQVKPERGDIVADVGAFTGDTSARFLQSTPEITKIYAFEPDKRNFLELKKLHQKYKNKLIPIRAAVWDTNRIIKLQSNLGVACHISPEGTEKVKAISLDTFFKNSCPSLIKMDIEGAEENAIKGCYNIIRKCKPKLQVCLYHNPYHLFRIPIFLKKIAPSYKFYIGHHHEFMWELVLYCH